MLKICLKNKDIELEFNGIKLFQTDNPTKLYKNLFLESESIFINNKIYKNDDIIYINELTKINEFINFSKKSFLTKLIFDLNYKFPIINYENIRKISENVNLKLDNELVENSEGDINKLINIFFEIIENMFLNIKTLKNILDNTDESKLIIFDNVSWINYKFLTNYLNEHKFIILTNDFRDYINNIDELETLVFFNKLEHFEILDNELTIKYIEEKLNIEINDEIFLNIISNKKDKNSINILNLLKNT